MMLTLGQGLSPCRRTSTTAADPFASCLFDIDATQSASYGGSGQTWANLIAAPADGSAQTAYDFQFGSSSGSDAADPTFNGTAGSQAAYFSFDGGDRFSLPANTTFVNNMPKTTGGSLPATFAIAWRAVTEGTTKTYVGNISSGPTVRVRVSSSQTVGLQQGNGSTFVQSAALSLSAGTDYLYIGAIDAAGNYRQWLNSRTQSSSGNITLVTNTANGARMDILSSAASGVRLYAVSLFNSYFSDADAAVLIDTYNARHGRTYA